MEEKAWCTENGSEEKLSEGEFIRWKEAKAEIAVYPGRNRAESEENDQTNAAICYRGAYRLKLCRDRESSQLAPEKTGLLELSAN